MPDLAHLRQRCQELRARTQDMQQRAIRAYHYARMAYSHATIAHLKLSMPEANPLTLAITADILASHGLLDTKPTLRRTDGVRPRVIAPMQDYKVIDYAGEAGKGRVTMTVDDFHAQCIDMINQLLTQGFQRPISLAAIASDGLAAIGSSETVTGAAPPGVKAATIPGAFALYLAPIHILFVDPQGRAAYGVIEGSGAASLRMLS